MFIEIKENEMINVCEIAAFHTYYNSNDESVRRNLYIRMKGANDWIRIPFETVRDCKAAYRRIIRALRHRNIVVEELIE